MSASVAKKPKLPKGGSVTAPPRVQGIVGVDIDERGEKLRPGTRIFFWTSNGPTGLDCCPGHLSRKMADGKWAVSYNQRHHPSFSTGSDFSPVPKLHCWSFESAYDAWEEENESKRSEG